MVTSIAGQQRVSDEMSQLWTACYSPPKGRMVIVDVPPIQFAMVEGAGDPNVSPEYAHALEALYSVAYGLKFAFKREQGIDFRVMPLEGLWWSPDMAAFTMERKSEWLWTMMIAQPSCVTREAFERAVAQARAKKSLPALDRIRLDTFHEGLAAQTLYLGPYSGEGPTIQRLHAYIREQGYELGGKHHEIYLGDPRRSAPEKLRTIIRQPMRAA